MAQRGRTRVRKEGAKQFNIWLNPKDIETLERYQERRGLASTTETFRAILRQMRKWLEKQDQKEHEQDQRVMGQIPVEEDEPRELRAAREALEAADQAEWD